MFWKKKNEPQKKSLIEQTADEVRGSFRVSPSSDEPIEFTFDKKMVSVSDLSAGGLSFKNDGFKVGTQEDVKLKLPGEETPMDITLEVIKIIEAKNICCCEFLELSGEDEDAIYGYAMKRQKEELRAKKKR